MSRPRRLALTLIPFVVLLGLACKAYRGPGFEWVNHWGPASVLYEVFFMLLAFLVFPLRNRITQIAMSVCLLTCAVEFLQRWQPSWLQIIRSNFWGRLVLGNSFSWWDFPAYFVGCFVGWMMLRGLTEPMTPIDQQEPHQRDR